MAIVHLARLLATFVLFAAANANPVNPKHGAQQFTKELRHDLKLPRKDQGKVVAVKGFKAGKVEHLKGATSGKAVTKPIVQVAARPASVAPAKAVKDKSTRAVSKPVARSFAKASVMPAQKLKKLTKDLRHDLSKITSKNKALAAGKTKPAVESTPHPASSAPTKAVNVVATPSHKLDREESTKPQMDRHVESEKPVNKLEKTAAVQPAHKLQQSLKDPQHGAGKVASKGEAVKPAVNAVDHATKASKAAAPAPKSAHSNIKTASVAPVVVAAHTSSKRTVTATKSAHGGAQPSTGTLPVAKPAVKMSGTKSNPFKFATTFLRKQADACQCQFRGTCTCDSTMEFMDCISAACASGKCDCHALQYQHACVDMAGTCNTLGFECKAEKAVCVSELESDRHYKKPQAKTAAEIYDELRKLKEDKCRFEMAKEDGWLNSQTQLNIAEKEIRSLLADLSGRGERLPEMHCGKHFDEYVPDPAKGGAVREGFLLLVAMAVVALLS